MFVFIGTHHSIIYKPSSLFVSFHSLPYYRPKVVFGLDMFTDLLNEQSS